MTKEAKSLEEFNLGYEDLEFHKVKKTSTTKKTVNKAKPTVKKKPQVTVKSRLSAAKKFIIAKLMVLKLKFEGVVNKALHPKKTAKKMTKKERELVIIQRKNGIMGIGLLLVIVSITYSTYIVRTFVDTNLSLLALAPQVVFALYILLKAFSKLYK